MFLRTDRYKLKSNRLFEGGRAGVIRRGLSQSLTIDCGKAQFPRGSCISPALAKIGYFSRSIWYKNHH